MSSESGKALLRALLIGALGGVLFQLTGLPLAWMLGPLIANLVASMRGVSVKVPEPLREGFLGMLGLVLGSQVTPALASRMLDWPLSAALLVAGITVSVTCVAAWYRRCGFDPVSAWFSAAPGAMTAMIMMGDKVGGDPQRIAVAQSLRVILVILTLPPLFWMLEDVDKTAVTTVATSGLWLLLALPVVIPLGRWLRLPTPSLLAPLALAAVLGITGTASFHPPQWGLDIMLWVLGSAIGSRFKGLSGRRLWRYVFESGVATAIALGVLAVFAELIHLTVGVPRDVALLALAPGGIGELAIVAVALNLDPVFVAFHHLLRMLMLMIVAPLWARWLKRQQTAHWKRPGRR
ncbi:AbrB family transcriptional regulator [Halomonas shantousis]